jgi:hypothetical protein
MTFNENDHPRGTAGRFTETHHAEAGNVALAPAGVSADPDRDAVRALMGVSARTGLSTDSVPYIAGLLQKGSTEVHEENVGTLAASYGVSRDAIQEVHRVVNHQELPLTVAAGVDENDADLLASGGLTGHLAPYTGDVDDLEDLDGPVAYTSASGRDLILSSVSDGEFTVTYTDGDEDNNFTLSQGTTDATAAEKAATVRDALWDLAVADANHGSPTPLCSGDFYELREISLGRFGGEPVGQFIASNDDGMYTTVTHDFSNGVTTLDRDGVALTGIAADLEMAAVFEGLQSEPDNGDFNAHAATVFNNLLVVSAGDTDAPRWATDAAATKGIS